jgi:TIMELESS-interacting protein
MLLLLSFTRLFTDKGLPYLSKEFPKLKFRGKGYEASDLKFLLKEYELWANIIYPKYTFKDFVRRVEALSTKSRQFKTEMKKMRYKSAGIPLPGEDDVTENEQITDHGELNISANLPPNPLDNNENDRLCKSSSLEVDIEEENCEPWNDIANDIIPHDDDIYDQLYEDVGELLNN